jgi:hypothetical protein
MSISFNCGFCGKRIEAPDSAGGKWGKCPGCHNRVYVSSPQAGDEEFRLAPIDDEEEKRRKELLAEEARLREEILSQTEAGNEPAGLQNRGRSAPEAGPSGAELTQSIIIYLRQMADGDLEQAEITVRAITPGGGKAVEILDRISRSTISEPELSDIPRQVLSGLIKNLQARIG